MPSSLMEKSTDRVPYRFTDPVLQNLLLGRTQRNTALDHSGSRHSASVLHLLTAYQQICVAITALENAQSALSIVDAGDLPTRTFKERANSIGGLMRKLLELVEDDDDPESGALPQVEHCVHSREIVWRHDVPFVAKEVAMEWLPEQMAKISAFLSRWKGSSTIVASETTR